MGCGLQILWVVACGSTSTVSGDGGQPLDSGTTVDGFSAVEAGLGDGGEPVGDGASPKDDSAKGDTFTPPDSAPSVCGDGVVEGVEQCDEGVFNSDLPDAPCRSDCTKGRCGDGVVDASESCDDGNGTVGDGCDSSCQTEGGSLLTALPSPLHFGTAIVGCSGSVAGKIELFNSSSADIPVTSAKLVGCGAEIVLGGTVPQMVPKSGSVAIDIVYLPAAVGVSNCVLEIVADGALYLPVTAEAIAKGAREDLFQQQLNRKVDYLFVLDGGGSMQDSLQGLQQSGQAFLNALSASKVDFHIGFIQLAPETPADLGVLQGDPLFLTPTTGNLYKLFVDRFTPAGGPQETGFDSITTALKPPLISTVAASCATCKAPNICVDGACRGQNWGFRRAGASLEVFIATDEEEQSVALAETVETFLRGLLNPLLGEFVRAHVLIPQTQCAEGKAFEKYNKIASATGGAVNDLCLPNFPQAFKSLADRTFGLLDQFTLSENPQPGTLKIAVDGVVTGAFDYEELSNTILLSPAPADGAVISASYEAICP